MKRGRPLKKIGSNGNGVRRGLTKSQYIKWQVTEWYRRFGTTNNERAYLNLWFGIETRKVSRKQRGEVFGLTGEEMQKKENGLIAKIVCEMCHYDPPKQKAQSK